MPWYKSRWRSRLNARYARWTALRGAALVAPASLRDRHFFGRAVSPEEAGAEAVGAFALTLDAPFSPEQAAFIEARCTGNDGGVGRYWEAPVRFEDRHFLVRDAVVLGHTGGILSPDGAALVTEDGRLADWNRDKPAALAAAAPIEGAVAPIRRFNSYFHFLFEFAVPFVELMESGGLTGRPVTLLLAEGSKRFAVETAAALAARYGLRVAPLDAQEKARVGGALIVARRRPCPDWYPVTRATADALASALTAHFGVSAAPGGGGRLYLRRGREKLRNLENAAAVEAALAARRFQTLQPAAYNFEQQIGLSAGADCIAAVHGAALANLLFARPGAQVVEMFNGRGCKSLYMLIAAMLGLKHVRVIGDAGDAKQNFSVDPEALAAALDAP